MVKIKTASELGIGKQRLTTGLEQQYQQNIGETYTGADALQSMGRVFKKRYEAQLQQGAVDLRRKVENYKFNPKTGAISTRKGKNSIGIAEKGVSDIEKMAEDIIKQNGFSGSSKEDFLKHVENILVTSTTQLSKHETSETNRYLMDGLQSDISLDKEVALRNPSDPNIINATLNSIKTNHEKIGRLRGDSQEVINERLVRENTQVLSQHIGLLIDIDPKKAVEELNKHSDYIAPLEREKLDDMVSTAIRHQTNIDEIQHFNTLYEDDKSFEAGLKNKTQNMSKNEKDDYIRIARQKYREEKFNKIESQEKIDNIFYDKMIETGISNIGDLKKHGLLGIYSKASPEAKDHMHRFIKQDTDLEYSIAQLKSISVNDPEKFNKINLYPYRIIDKLGYEDLSKAQRSLRRGGSGGNTMKRYYEQDDQIKKALASFKITSPSEINRFTDLISAKIEKFERENGLELGISEQRKIMAREMIKFKDEKTGEIRRLAETRRTELDASSVKNIAKLKENYPLLWEDFMDARGRQIEKDRKEKSKKETTNESLSRARAFTNIGVTPTDKEINQGFIDFLLNLKINRNG